MYTFIILTSPAVTSFCHLFFLVGFTATDLVSSGQSNSPAFAQMVAAASSSRGGLMTVDQIARGAMMILDDPTMAGKVLSVSRDLGYALHDTPTLYPQVVAVPHKQIGTLEPMAAKL